MKRENNAGAKRLSINGLSLFELLVGMGLMGLFLGLVGSEISQRAQRNNRTELRSTAFELARQALETRRARKVNDLPTSGNEPPTNVVVGNTRFRIEVSYCVNATLCAADRRQLSARVLAGGQELAKLETVFGRLGDVRPRNTNYGGTGVSGAPSGPPATPTPVVTATPTPFSTHTPTPTFNPNARMT